MQCNCFIIMLSNARFFIKTAMELKYILNIFYFSVWYDCGKNKNKKASFEYFFQDLIRIRFQRAYDCFKTELNIERDIYIGIENLL